MERVDFFICTIFNNNPIIEERTIAVLVLILSVVLFLMRVIKKKDEARKGTAYIVSNTLFLTVCGLEILYAVFSKTFGNIPWFCSPEEVGWLWTIINFFLLGGVVVNQILYLFDVIGDVFANDNVSCSLKLGYYSWIGGFVCLLPCAFFFQDGVPYVFLLVGLMQIIQSVLIFRSYGKNIKGASWGVSVYLLGTIGTVLVFTTLLVMLIIVVLGALAIWLVLKLMGTDEAGSVKKGRIHYSDGSSEEATGEKGPLGETYWKGKDSGNTHTTSF